MRYSELLQRMHDLDAKLQDQYGEITESDEKEMSKLDDSLEWWSEFLVGKYVNDLAEAQKCKDLAQGYANRVKYFENRAEYRKKGLFVLATDAEKSGIKLATATATVFKSKGKETVEIPDEQKVPEEFKNVPTPDPKIDRIKIMRALKSGEKFDWAFIKDGEEHVKIKV